MKSQRQRVKGLFLATKFLKTCKKEVYLIKGVVMQAKSMGLRYISNCSQRILLFLSFRIYRPSERLTKNS
jgi:hypothetical protein